MKLTIFQSNQFHILRFQITICDFLNEICSYEFSYFVQLIFFSSHKDNWLSLQINQQNEIGFKIYMISTLYDLRIFQSKVDNASFQCISSLFKVNKINISQQSLINMERHIGAIYQLPEVEKSLAKGRVKSSVGENPGAS